MFTRTITAVAVIYTALCLALLLWTRSVASPTGGGISPSELLEGLVPGGLFTVLALWVVLFLVAAGAWVWDWGNKRKVRQ